MSGPRIPSQRATFAPPNAPPAAPPDAPPVVQPPPPKKPRIRSVFPGTNIVPPPVVTPSQPPAIQPTMQPPLQAANPPPPVFQPPVVNPQFMQLPVVNPAPITPTNSTPESAWQGHASFGAGLQSSLSNGGISWDLGIDWQWWPAFSRGLELSLGYSGSSQTAHLFLPTADTNPSPFASTPVPGASGTLSQHEITLHLRALSRSRHSPQGAALWSASGKALGFGFDTLHTDARNLTYIHEPAHDASFTHFLLSNSTEVGAEFTTGGFAIIPYAALVIQLPTYFGNEFDRERTPSPPRIITASIGLRLGAATFTAGISDHAFPQLSTAEAIGHTGMFFGVPIIETVLTQRNVQAPLQAVSTFTSGVTGQQTTVTAPSAGDVSLILLSNLYVDASGNGSQDETFAQSPVAAQVVQGVFVGGKGIAAAAYGDRATPFVKSAQLIRFALIGSGQSADTILATPAAMGGGLQVLGGVIAALAPGPWGNALYQAGHSISAEAALAPNPTHDAAFAKQSRARKEFGVTHYTGPHGSGMRGMFCAKNVFHDYGYLGVCLASPLLSPTNLGARVHKSDEAAPDSGLPTSFYNRVGATHFVSFDAQGTYGFEYFLGWRTGIDAVGSGTPFASFGAEAGARFKLGPVTIGAMGSAMGLLYRDTADERHTTGAYEIGGFVGLGD